MKFDKKQSFRHRANKNRDHEIDRDDKTWVQKILKENFNLNALRDEVLRIPQGGYYQARRPDLLIKSQDPQIAIELHGEGVHGVGDEVSEPERDKRRKSDYDLLLPEIKLIIIYSAKTDGYDKELVTTTLKNAGLVPLING